MSNAKSNEKEKSKVKFVDEEKMMFIELVSEFWPNQLALKKQDSKTLQLKEQAWSSIHRITATALKPSLTLFN